MVTAEGEESQRVSEEERRKESNGGRKSLTPFPEHAARCKKNKTIKASRCKKHNR